MKDEDYDLLRDSLGKGGITMTRKCTNQEKRVYRLFQSRLYNLNVIFNPVSGIEENRIVSLFITFSVSVSIAVKVSNETNAVPS